MDRRHLLKQLALITGGAVSLPTWAQNWSLDTLPAFDNTFLSQQQQAVLAELIDVIIPATETPGAKELGVHKFIETMLNDCYDKSDQQKFSQALDEFIANTKKLYGKDFIGLAAKEKVSIVEKLDKENLESTNQNSSTYSLIKGLTIQGYLYSEYVMKNILKYQLIPGGFKGSVPVAK